MDKKSLFVVYAPIIISLISLLISLSTGFFTIQNHLYEKKQNVLSRAPNYTVDSLIFSHQDYSFPPSYADPDASHFIFAKRRFLLDTLQGKRDAENSPAYCLVIDLRPDSSYEKISITCFDTIEIHNNGFDAHYFEIMGIDFVVDDSIFQVAASKQKSINYRIDKERPLIIMLSMIVHEKTNLVESSAIYNNAFLQEKIEETKGELLNARFENMADKWEKIILHIKSKNTYNEIYVQDIILAVENETYISYSLDPKLCKN